MSYALTVSLAANVLLGLCLLYQRKAVEDAHRRRLLSESMLDDEVDQNERLEKIISNRNEELANLRQTRDRLRTMLEDKVETMQRALRLIPDEPDLVDVRSILLQEIPPEEERA